MSDVFKSLAAPFPPEKTSWRVGSMTQDKSKGMALAYIDARDVMERLDTVCGQGGWQSDLYDAGSERLACKIGILANSQWIWKCDGAGGREAHKGLSEQDANKGSFSDAFKRAAVQWGIGRYLYYVQPPWVELDQWKKIKPDQQWKLDKALEKVGSTVPAIISNASSQDNQPDTPQSITREQRIIAGRPSGKRFENSDDSDLVFKAAITFLPSGNTQAEIDQYCKANSKELSSLQDDHYARFIMAMNDAKKKLPEGFKESA